MITQLTVEQLKEKKDRNDNFKLVDVREVDEHKICHIEGSVLIPLSQFQAKYSELLKPAEEIVVHCHHGGRSQKACEFLASQGFTNISNLSGGIHEWSQKIDPKVPTY